MLLCSILFLLLPSFSYGTCSTGAVRLYGHTANEGAVEFCRYNSWYSACNFGWDCREANVVCRELGYGKAISVVSNSYSTYGYRSSLYNSYYYSCTGSESSLNSCLFYSSSYCNNYHNTVGVRCLNLGLNYNFLEFNGNCTQPGAVRLTGGITDMEGIVEYCYDNHWIPLCTVDDEEATVVCKQLGYQPFASLSSDEQFSYRNFTSQLSISCSSYASQSSLSQCTISYFSNDNDNTVCASSTDSYQNCYNPKAVKCYSSNVSTCTDGAVRLMDGSVDQEGRVEVCVNGVWSSICSTGWNTDDAKVICKQLGYADSIPVISTNGKYGRGDGPIYFSNVNCQGWERSFTVCSKSSYLHFTCNNDSYIAGTLCTDGCTEGEIRLVGGVKITEGTTEICHNNLWGLITDAGWDNRDATVICRQLDMPTKGAIAVYGSKFGKPNRAVHYSYALCNGNETSLINCNKLTHSLAEGRMIYRDVGAAGVMCLSSATSTVTSSHCNNYTSSNTIRIVSSTVVSSTTVVNVQPTTVTCSTFTAPNIVIVALLLFGIILILILCFAFFVYCIKNKIKKQKLLRRPLPAVTMSSLHTSGGSSRYTQLHSSDEDHEVKELTQDDEMPTTLQQEDPYSSDHYETDPLYEFPKLKT